jgi:hypothetical protein
MRPIFGGFCINQFGLGPLHDISSRSDFSFEFAEIFVIEKQLPDLLSCGVTDSDLASRAVVDFPIREVGH